MKKDKVADVLRQCKAATLSSQRGGDGYLNHDYQREETSWHFDTADYDPLNLKEDEYRKLYGDLPQGGSRGFIPPSGPWRGEMLYIDAFSKVHRLTNPYKYPKEATRLEPGYEPTPRKFPDGSRVIPWQSELRKSGEKEKKLADRIDQAMREKERKFEYGGKTYINMEHSWVEVPIPPAGGKSKRIRIRA